MKTKTNCLFGGALIGAGLCAGAGSSALAGDFVWELASSTISLNYNTYFSTNYYGDFEHTRTNPSGSTASVRGDSSGFSSFASASDLAPSRGGSPFFGHASTNGYGYFSVTTDMSVLFEWDLTADGIGYGYGRIIDMYAFSTYEPSYMIVDFAAGDSGSFTTTLLAGRSYRLEHYIFSGIGATGVSSFSMTVAAVPLPPGALAGLGMLAGLGAYKRIRRR